MTALVGSYTLRERRRLSQTYGGRPVNNWGSGDLPAPWCMGDVVHAPDDALALGVLKRGPGVYVVGYVCSIDEGDGWYTRLRDRESSSDRLHVAWAARSDFTEDVDMMAGCTLLDTPDPEGLARRERMLAAGWVFAPKWDVYRERDLYRTALEAIRSGCGAECAAHALSTADRRNGR